MAPSTNFLSSGERIETVNVELQGPRGSDEDDCGGWEGRVLVMHPVSPEDTSGTIRISPGWINDEFTILFAVTRAHTEIWKRCAIAQSVSPFRITQVRTGGDVGAGETVGAGVGVGVGIGVGLGVGVGTVGVGLGVASGIGEGVGKEAGIFSG